MISWLISLPIFLILLMLQVGVVSETPLLKGTADLILVTIIAWSLQERNKSVWQWAIIGSLFVGFVSKSSVVMVLISYLFVTGIVLYARRKIWQAPILTMLTMTVIGTGITQGFVLAIRWFESVEIPFLQAFNMIILPSMVLNLLVAIPIFLLVRDLANWLYPAEIAV